MSYAEVPVYLTLFEQKRTSALFPFVVGRGKMEVRVSRRRVLALIVTNLPLILVDSTGESHLSVELGGEANLARSLAVTNGADFHALSH